MDQDQLQYIHMVEYYPITEKEQTVDTCSNVDKSQNNYSERKKSDEKS